MHGNKYSVNLKASGQTEATCYLTRLEETRRLVERGRMTVPSGAGLGLFLLSGGRLAKPVAVARPVRLAEVFATYRAEFSAGA